VRPRRVRDRRRIRGGELVAYDVADEELQRLEGEAVLSALMPRSAAWRTGPRRCPGADARGGGRAGGERLDILSAQRSPRRAMLQQGRSPPWRETACAKRITCAQRGRFSSTPTQEMRMKTFARRVAIAVLCGLAGCATAGTVRSGVESGRGTTRVYDGATFDEVYAAALKVMGDKFVLTNESRDRGLIEAEAPVSAFSWGEVIAVRVARLEVSQVKVTALSLKRARLQVTGQNWELSIVLAIASELERLRAEAPRAPPAPSPPSHPTANATAP
jgi:hypothetical protein